MQGKFTITAVLLAVAAAAVLGTQSVGAAGNAERGRLLAATCLGCHGVPGYTNAYPSYHVPRLGGQHADYIAAALTAYRSEERSHPTMRSQAGSMSDQDIADIASYFAGFGAPKAGERRGEAPEAAEVCATCHGPAGVSASPAFPNIAGQYADYLEQSLKQYKSGARKNPIMGGQVAAMSDEDMGLLAEYFSRQSGLFTTEP